MQNFFDSQKGVSHVGNDPCDWCDSREGGSERERTSGLNEGGGDEGKEKSGGSKEGEGEEGEEGEGEEEEEEGEEEAQEFVTESEARQLDPSAFVALYKGGLNIQLQTFFSPAASDAH